MSDAVEPKQAHMRAGRIVCVAVCAVLALSLAACGKRPGAIDPPVGVQNDTYPRIYPDPATDPQPKPPEGDEPAE